MTIIFTDYCDLYYGIYYISRGSDRVEALQNEPLQVSRQALSKRSMTLPVRFLAEIYVQVLAH